jgi:hypothetical protein
MMSEKRLNKQRKCKLSLLATSCREARHFDPR